MSAGGDIKKYHFVRALIVVPQGEFNWITHIPELPRFSSTKLNSSGDFSIMHIQAWNDSSCQHVIEICETDEVS